MPHEMSIVNHYIIQFHKIGENEHIRIDFSSSNSPIKMLQSLLLKKYHTYQVILAENNFTMSTSELDSQNIRYDMIPREKKTWFGFRTKIVQDLLIHPHNSFYYPYEFGNYLYINTLNIISKSEINDWLIDQFPNRWEQLGYAYSGLNKNPIKLLNRNDYLIIRSHDNETHFGIAAVGFAAGGKQ